ncbi:MAG TPA: ABC transporter permease [Pyrinomonadaceae bacterium]|nr:ABC transporter permease [Pyrinomonadaceae bacterium]
MDSLVTANIKQRPVRSLVSAAGVALGVALVMLFTGLARGMSNEMQHRSSNVLAEIIFTRPGSMELTSSMTNLNVKYVDRLKAIEGVEAVVPVIRYISQGGKGFGFEQIEGVDWEPFSRMNNISLVEGRAPTANDEVVIDTTKAQNGNYRPGSVLELFGGKPYRIVGIYAPESGARIKMSLAAMQDALESPGKCTYILVKCKQGYDQIVVAKNIDRELQGNKIQFTRDVFANIEKSIPYLNVFLRVLVGLATIVSALVVMLAMYTTITERTREIGILKAMGASRAYIISEIEKEAILISLLGLVAGFVAAVIAGLLVQKFYSLTFEIAWPWVVASVAIGLLGGALGALYPAVRAANLDPVSALAYE